MSAESSSDADRRACELIARQCYEQQGLAWHGNVIWVSSPLVVEMAGVLASFMICRPGNEAQPGMLSDWVSRGLPTPLAEVIATAVAAAIDAARRGAVQLARSGPLYPVLKEAVIPPQDEELIARAADGVVERCCRGDSAGRSFWLDAACTVLPGGAFTPGGRRHGTIDPAWWWFTHRDFILVAEQPTQVQRESLSSVSGRQSARLHNLQGPAITWSDGWSIHAVRGLDVPGWIIEQSGTITVADIERETNAELRRTLLECYGWQRYISDCGAEVVDSVPMDHGILGLRGARLLRKELPGEPEPLVYLEMVNSTPEPDGSLRHYLERIDPKAYGGKAATSCHAAMASRWHHRDEHGRLLRTFERWQDYLPTGES
jgi:hypothetical protein